MSARRNLAFGLCGVSALGICATAVFAYTLNGNKWPGSHPLVPFYISTTLQGNVPYDVTLQEGVQHGEPAL